MNYQFLSVMIICSQNLRDLCLLNHDSSYFRLKDVVAVLKMGEVVFESAPQLATQWFAIRYKGFVSSGHLIYIDGK